MPPKRKGGRAGGGSGGGRKGGLKGGQRPKAVRVAGARRRKPSSTAWLNRQLNDPFVAEARRLGYRSRAAFKLIEIDDRLHLLTPGRRVADLGAAPGGWSQVAAERIAERNKSAIVAVDLLDIDPIAGVTVVTGDFREPSVQAAVRAALGGPADLVLSDLSPAATGHRATDHLRIVALVEAAFAFAEEVLAPGGDFVAKVFQGGAEVELLARAKRAFTAVRHVKPKASRAESAEVYLVATGFRGRAGASEAQSD